MTNNNQTITAPSTRRVNYIGDSLRVVTDEIGVTIWQKSSWSSWTDKEPQRVSLYTKDQVQELINVLLLGNN